MKQIGNTEDHNILVEMLPVEWFALQALEREAGRTHKRRSTETWQDFITTPKDWIDAVYNFISLREYMRALRDMAQGHLDMYAPPVLKTDEGEDR